MKSYLKTHFEGLDTTIATTNNKKFKIWWNFIQNMVWWYINDTLNEFLKACIDTRCIYMHAYHKFVYMNPTQPTPNVWVF